MPPRCNSDLRNPRIHPAQSRPGMKVRTIDHDPCAADSKRSVIAVAVEVAPLEGEVPYARFHLSQLRAAPGVRELGVSVVWQGAGVLPGRVGVLLIIATGQGSEHGGAVDSSAYQLCANLHVAECNWLVKMNPSVPLPSC